MGAAEPLRSVEHQPVPLAFHVIVLRLLRDIEAVKLQLPGQFLLPLKDHQGHLVHGGKQGCGGGVSGDHSLGRNRDVLLEPS